MSDRVPVIHVSVEDWYQIGDAREVQTEDGPVIRNPDHAPCIMVETDCGERYVHTHEFPNTEEGWNAAGALATAITAAGDIDTEHWVYHYPSYGSAAWQNENDIAQDYVRSGRGCELKGHVLGGLV